MNVSQVLKNAEKIRKAENKVLMNLSNIIDALVMDAQRDKLDPLHTPAPAWLLTDCEEWNKKLRSSNATRSLIHGAQRILRKHNEWLAKLKERRHDH